MDQRNSLKPHRAELDELLAKARQAPRKGTPEYALPDDFTGKLRTAIFREERRRLTSLTSLCTLVMAALITIGSFWFGEPEQDLEPAAVLWLEIEEMQP